MRIKALKHWQKEQLVSNGFLDWQIRSFEAWARGECARGNRRRMARMLRSLTAIKNK